MTTRRTQSENAKTEKGGSYATIGERDGWLNKRGVK
jgi:hypothetical protein